MEALRSELTRLGRAEGRVRGSRLAAWVHLLLLGAAFALACVHRLGLPLPGLTWIDRRWVPVLVVALALLAVGPLLTRLLARFVRPRTRALARRLDERFAWRDETTTAVGLEEPDAARAVPALLVAQTTGRLRGLKPEALGHVRRPRRWPRLLLAFLFAYVLLAPGTRWFPGVEGPGSEPEAAAAGTQPLEPVGPPQPMPADFWLQSFVENPLPVEPLPPPPRSPDAESPR